LSEKSETWKSIGLVDGSVSLAFKRKPSAMEKTMGYFCFSLKQKYCNLLRLQQPKMAVGKKYANPGFRCFEEEIKNQKEVGVKILKI
jgi:hypothetical protein